MAEYLEHQLGASSVHPGMFWSMGLSSQEQIPKKGLGCYFLYYGMVHVEGTKLAHIQQHIMLGFTDSGFGTASPGLVDKWMELPFPLFAS